MNGPRTPVLARARAAFVRIATENASPGRLLAACVLGGMIGATPLFGLHLPLCIALGTVLRLNRVAMYGAANVSLPPLVPLVAGASIAVGERLLGHHGVLARVEQLRLASPWDLGGELFLAWLLGAPLVGGAAGLALGAAVAVVAARGARARDPSAFDRRLHGMRARFAGAPVRVRQYVRWKSALDPGYRLVDQAIPVGSEVVDLGAGFGALAILLALGGRRVRAVEWDALKADAARAAAHDLPVEVFHEDARDAVVPACDAVVLLDLLHYLAPVEQTALLARAAGALRPGGALLVRDADGARRDGAVTRAMERLAVYAGWNRGGAEGPAFRSASAIADELRGLGLVVDDRDASSALHPGNRLLRAVKPGSNSGTHA